MASSRGFTERRKPPMALNRSNSEQLLLRKREDWNYMEQPSMRPTPRDRKAISDANEAQMHAHHHAQHPSTQQQQQQRTRAGTAVISRFGNDQSEAVNGSTFRLNRKEKLFLIKRAKESAIALIDHAHTLDGPIQWHYKGKHQGIQMYRGEGFMESGGVPASAVLGSSEQSLEFLCGVTTMMGTLEEVSEYFDQSTTARMKMKKAEDVLDCAVLYSLVCGNTVNPFTRVSVKYNAYEGPAAMTRPRDFCFLECQDTFRHASGRRGWVLSMHSIKIPSCPELPGFVRGSVYHSGLVFVESERPGYMDVMYSLQINFKGHGRVPQFMLNSALKKRLRELIHISREIQVARMAHRTLLDERDLMPKKLRSSCVHCSRRFWLLLRKTRCRVCGDVVCQTCAPIVEYDGVGSNGQHIKTRICVKCYSTAPTTGSWSALNEGLPWSEESRLAAEFQKKKTSMPELPSHRGLMMHHVEEGDEDEYRGQGDHDQEGEDDDDDDDGEGRFTFAELEEQSSHSVFAPERFTRSSMASLGSIAPLQVDEIAARYNGTAAAGAATVDNDDMSSIRSSEYKWQRRATEDSEFDHIGSLSSSIISRDSYFGRAPEPAAPPSIRFSSRHPALHSVVDDAPLLMEEPDHNQVSHANNHRVSKKHQQVTPPPLPPARPAAPAQQEPHAQPVQLQHSVSLDGTKSSYDFLDGLIDLPIATTNSKNNSPIDGPRQRAQTTIHTSTSRTRSELNPSTLHAHNLRYMRGKEGGGGSPPPPKDDDQPVVNLADLHRPTPPEGKTALVTGGTPPPRASDTPMSLDDIVRSNSLSSTNESFDGHATGASSIDTNSLFSRPSSLILRQVRKNRSKTIHLQPPQEDLFRSTKEIDDKAADHRRRMAELNQKAIEYTGNRVSSLEITRPSLEPEAVDDDVWRSSALMEEYRTRRKHTIEALRKKALSIQEDGRESTGTDRTTASSARSPSISEAMLMGRSPSITGSRIVQEIHNRNSHGRSPSLLAAKMSESGPHSPIFTGRKGGVGAPSEISMRGLSEDLSFHPSVSIDEPLQELMQHLCVQEDEEHADAATAAAAIHQEEPEPELQAAVETVTTATASATAKRGKPEPDFVTARSLYAEIGNLTKLHSEIAMAEDESEVDRIKSRIQEQYQLIRHLQLKP